MASGVHSLPTVYQQILYCGAMQKFTAVRKPDRVTYEVKWAQWKGTLAFYWRMTSPRDISETNELLLPEEIHWKRLCLKARSLASATSKIYGLLSRLPNLSRWGGNFFGWSLPGTDEAICFKFCSEVAINQALTYWATIKMDLKGSAGLDLVWWETSPPPKKIGSKRLLQTI